MQNNVAASVATADNAASSSYFEPCLGQHKQQLMKTSNRGYPIKLVIEVTPYVSVLLAYACFIIPCIIGQKKEIADIAIIDNYNSLSQTPKMMGSGSI